MDLNTLVSATEGAAALRRRRRLQPAGGPGDKIFPPTYPGRDGPQHVFERRRVAQESGEFADVHCVLIDSVQSQANRLEEALEAAALSGQIELPRIVVDFAGREITGIGEISDLVAPHRIFDAILRDAEHDGKAFRESDLGKDLRLATAGDASAILNVSPASLLFGAWNSTGEGGGIGAKFARAIVSEIMGIGCAVEEITDQRTGEILTRTAGRRTGSRIDPLGITKSVDVFEGADGWALNKKDAGAGAKQVRPSEINHGNIAPSIDQLGVTCEYAEQTSVITLAGLRRLSFSGRKDPMKDQAGRAYLAALGLLALSEGDLNGYALRSRCDLVCEGDAPIQLVNFDGSTEEIRLAPEDVRALYMQALKNARDAGFELAAQPLALKPSDKLVELVRHSQNKALNDEADAD